MLEDQLAERRPLCVCTTHLKAKAGPENDSIRATQSRFVMQVSHACPFLPLPFLSSHDNVGEYSMFPCGCRNWTRPQVEDRFQRSSVGISTKSHPRVCVSTLHLCRFVGHIQICSPSVSAWSRSRVHVSGDCGTFSGSSQRLQYQQQW